jgi:LysM repeat protein
MNNNFKTIIIDPGHGGVDIGFDDGVHYEKDYNLEIGKYIYSRLMELGFPVYITRSSDETISNYDRFEFLDEITEANNGGSLVFSIQVDDENSNGISIIRSVNRDYGTNKGLDDKLNSIGSVNTKTLAGDDGRDYYAIQRLAPEGSEAIVIEYGYNFLNDLKVEKERLGEELVQIIIDYFGKVDFHNNDYVNYVVQKGDNLYNLSMQYEIEIDDIKKLNGLGTDFLTVGQILKLPKCRENIYIVKKGDSLYSIAKKFDTTVDKIKDINKLLSNKLIINQKIIIPD